MTFQTFPSNDAKDYIIIEKNKLIHFLKNISFNEEFKISEEYKDGFHDGWIQSKKRNDLSLYFSNGCPYFDLSENQFQNWIHHNYDGKNE